jgi:hypothetical protein
MAASRCEPETGYNQVGDPGERAYLRPFGLCDTPHTAKSDTVVCRREW